MEFNKDEIEAIFLELHSVLVSKTLDQANGKLSVDKIERLDLVRVIFEKLAKVAGFSINEDAAYAIQLGLWHKVSDEDFKLARDGIFGHFNKCVAEYYLRELKGSGKNKSE
jgi:hypothetical protein